MKTTGDISIQAKLNQYRPHAQRALDDLIAYFRTNKEELQRPNRKNVLDGKLRASSGGEVKQAIMNEYKIGYLLCHHFFENLPAYEQSSEPMATYFTKLMTGIDVKKEKMRWREACN